MQYISCLFHACDKYLRAFHVPGTIPGSSNTFVDKIGGFSVFGELIFFRRDRKEISKQVNNIIKYSDECHEGKMPRVTGLGKVCVRVPVYWYVWICMCVFCVCVCIYLCDTTDWVVRKLSLEGTV